MKWSNSRLWFVAAALCAALVAQAAAPAKPVSAKPAPAKPAPAPAAAAPKKPKPDPKKMTVDDIRGCMRDNFAERGSLRDLIVKATDRDGQSHDLKMKLFWKPDKANHAR